MSVLTLWSYGRLGWCIESVHTVDAHASYCLDIGDFIEVLCASSGRFRVVLSKVFLGVIPMTP